MDTDRTMPPHKFRWVTPYMKDIQKNFLLYRDGKFYQFVFSKGRYTMNEGEDNEERVDFEEVCFVDDDGTIQTIGDDHVFPMSKFKEADKAMWDAAATHAGVTFQIVGFHHPQGDMGAARDIVPINGEFLVNRLGCAIVAERKSVEGNKYPFHEYCYPIPAEDTTQRAFFDARDEVIDVLENIDDFWFTGEEDLESEKMKTITYNRTESVLNLLERVRKALNYPDRPHDTVVSRDKSEESH